MTETSQFTESTLKPRLVELTFNQLVLFAEDLAEEIRYHAGQDSSDEQWADTQAMKVVEEAGEFIGAYNRYKGFCRRKADIKEVRKELADVIIASLIMFATINYDAQADVKAKLYEVITRGYVNKDEAS